MSKKKGKNHFEHSSIENIDAAIHYLSMVSKGLRKRKISLEKEDEMLHLELPDQAEFTIRAKKGKKKRHLSFSLDWSQSEK